MADIQHGSPGKRSEAEPDLIAIRRDLSRLREDVGAILAELRGAGLIGPDRREPPGLLGGVAALEAFGEGSLAQLGLGPWIGVVARGVRAAPLLSAVGAACVGWTLASLVRR